ncbi:unnamed protein product, partial [Ectocarpus sp. 8 AP-2014]
MGCSRLAPLPDLARFSGFAAPFRASALIYREHSSMRKSPIHPAPTGKSSSMGRCPIHHAVGFRDAIGLMMAATSTNHTRHPCRTYIFLILKFSLASFSDLPACSAPSRRVDAHARTSTVACVPTAFHAAPHIVRAASNNPQTETEAVSPAGAFSATPIVTDCSAASRHTAPELHRLPPD